MDLTLEQRQVIYRARRGLKELDIYFDPYVKQHYVHADLDEQAVFKDLIAEEDPDLLDWFMEAAEPPSINYKMLIQKLKHYVHG